ncbi:unnamed protein product [Periconia digitata]|uniref:Secreted protein n=1 Tax=Periconia digitata TaxID=1303443 RepID=A0A9W4UKZ1_9PLEO|nr:unnamed protein product [Periconia digitata]
MTYTIRAFAPMMLMMTWWPIGIVSSSSSSTAFPDTSSARLVRGIPRNAPVSELNLYSVEEKRMDTHVPIGIPFSTAQKPLRQTMHPPVEIAMTGLFVASLGKDRRTQRAHLLSASKPEISIHWLAGSVLSLGFSRSIHWS